MAKINRRRLSNVISFIVAATILSFGVWLLISQFKPFSTTYLHQRNVQHIEAKYGKPYAVYRQEEKDACIAKAQQEPIGDNRGASWLSALSSDKDVINERIRICDYGTTEISVSSNDVWLAYFQKMALYIIIFICGAIFVSWLLGVLLTRTLPALFTAAKSWLTSNDESGS